VFVASDSFFSIRHIEAIRTDRRRGTLSSTGFPVVQIAFDVGVLEWP